MASGGYYIHFLCFTLKNFYLVTAIQIKPLIRHISIRTGDPIISRKSAENIYQTLFNENK